MARDCKKCMHFRVMHHNYNDSFACELDPYCSWIEYKTKKVCKNYEEADETQTTTNNNRHTVAKENKMDDTNEAKVDMDAQAAMSRPLSKCIRTNADVVFELAVERMEVSQKLAKLERAIEANPAAVSEHHKELWRKQAEAMRAYKDVLGERIKDLIDG